MFFSFSASDFHDVGTEVEETTDDFVLKHVARE
jgi:hypothetical protein